MDADADLDGSDTIIADNTYAYDERGNLLAEQSYGDLAATDSQTADQKEVGYAWSYASAAQGGGNRHAGAYSARVALGDLLRKLRGGLLPGRESRADLV